MLPLLEQDIFSMLGSLSANQWGGITGDLVPKGDAGQGLQQGLKEGGPEALERGEQVQDLQGQVSPGGPQGLAGAAEGTQGADCQVDQPARGVDGGRCLTLDCMRGSPVQEEKRRRAKAPAASAKEFQLTLVPALEEGQDQEEEVDQRTLIRELVSKFLRDMIDQGPGPGPAGLRPMGFFFCCCRFFLHAICCFIWLLSTYCTNV